jgi:hypothetical protein
VFKTVQTGGQPVPVVSPEPLVSPAGAISIWLIFRAFASGCTAMTGVEAVSNGVPIFAEPRVKNTRGTLKNLWAERVERPSREAGLKTPRLEIVSSPFRQLFQPILDFVDGAKEEHPEQLVAVVVPELVQPRWWEYLLYNHAAAGLKAALLLHGAEHLVVINTPWYIRELPSSTRSSAH